MAKYGIEYDVCEECGHFRLSHDYGEGECKPHHGCHEECKEFHKEED